MPTLRLSALLGLALMSGCASLSGDPAPSIGAMPPLYVPGVERTDGQPVAQRLPADLGLTVPGNRLPGASLNSRGSVRAIVFPVSFGERLPLWSDTAIAANVIGSAVPGQERSTAGRLAQASGGLFRLDASVFPGLVDTGGQPDSLLAHDPSGAGLTGMARTVLGAWASRVNLAAYDNDGPDGQPMSGDDDGKLDFVIMAVETDATAAVLRLDTPISLPVGQGGRLQTTASPVFVMTLPRTGRLRPENLAGTALVLRAMGLETDEMFFPSNYPTPISTVARVRLGWLPAQWAGRSGTYGVVAGRALVVPVVDVDNRRGLWLLERDAETLYLTRVARKTNGHFAVVESRRVTPGESGTLIPLTASQGETGPRLEIAWPGAAEGVTATVSLTPRH